MPYWRTVLTFEVLTKDDQPYQYGELEDLAYDVTDGHASGACINVQSEQVDAARMAELLIAQGSDPAFLLDDESP